MDKATLRSLIYIKQTLSQPETIKLVNFLYCGATNSGTLNLGSLISRNKTSTRVLASIFNNLRTHDLWWECTKNLIKEKYREYLKEFKILKKIKYIIVSEAPPGFKGFTAATNPNNQTISNYIFGEKPTGPYYNTPVDAFCSYRNGGDLKKCFAENGVAFVDLLPLPLPLETGIRKSWSTSGKFRIDNKPLPVVLLELALEEFFSNCRIISSCKPKLALMMPPTMAFGIIDYYRDSKEDLLVRAPFFRAIRLKNSHITEDFDNKIIYSAKRLAVSKSNNPNKDLLKTALDID